MKEWKHFTFEQRKVISSGLSHGKTAKEIALELQCDPTSVSKEVKRNRKETSIGLLKECTTTQRWPHVCSNCNKRYGNCPLKKV